MAQPMVHMLATGTNLKEQALALAQLGEASRVVHQFALNSIIFTLPQQMCLEEDRPCAFATYLSEKRVDKQVLHPGKTHWPVLTLIQEARDLKIPVALLTPRLPEDVTEHVILPGDSDRIITTGSDPEAIAEPLREWLSTAVVQITG